MGRKLCWFLMCLCSQSQAFGTKVTEHHWHSSPQRSVTFSTFSHLQSLCCSQCLHLLLSKSPSSVCELLVLALSPLFERLQTLNFPMFMYRRTACDLLPNGWFCLMCCNKFINVTLQPKWWKQENLKHRILLILAAMKKVSSIPTTPCAFCFSLRDQREDTRNWDV